MRVKSGFPEALGARTQGVAARMDAVLAALDRGPACRGIEQDCRRALARARITLLRQRALGRAHLRRACAEADLYAHRHPWRTATIASVMGLALGTLAGVLAARRRE